MSCRAASGARRSNASQPARNRWPTALPSAAYPVGRRPGQQRQPFREWAPRRRWLALAFARRLEHPAPGHRMEPRDRLDHPPERRIVDHRVVSGPLPGDELGRQIGHEDRHAVAVRCGAEVGDRRARQPRHGLARAGREPALAQVVVARRAGDPVLGERGPLQHVVPADRVDEAGEGGTGPAVGRERVLGAQLEAVLGQQLQQGSIAPADHHRVSRAPGRRRCRPGRRRGTRRANRGSSGSGPRPAARPTRRSPRRGSRRPGCR